MSAIGPDLYRQVLGHLPTGVTVIAADGESGPVGMAVNSFTSVSLDPPLVLFCPARSSSTWPAIRDAGRFCVSVMAGHHEKACRRFADPRADRFAGIPWSPRPCGPALDDAVAWIDCLLEDEHEAGDHTIAVGAVVAMEAASAVSPLVFFQGCYGTFL